MRGFEAINLGSLIMRPFAGVQGFLSEYKGPGHARNLNQGLGLRVLNPEPLDSKSPTPKPSINP